MAARTSGLASSAAVLSFIVALGLAKALTNLGAGALAQRAGRRRLLIAGWAAALPVPPLIAVAPNWNWIIAANILLGVNQGLAWSMTVVMKIDLVGPQRRGLALGLNESAGYGGVVLAAGLSGLLAGSFAARDVLVGSDRVGRKPLIVAGMLVQAAALALLTLSNGAITVAAAAAILLGAGTALVYPTLIAHPDRPRARRRRLPLLARHGLRLRRPDRRRRRRHRVRSRRRKVPVPRSADAHRGALLASHRTRCRRGSRDGPARYRLLHVAGRLAFHARAAILRIDARWRPAARRSNRLDP